MADKSVRLKLAIDGEAEYKSALQKINAETKTLGTESKKLEAQFADSANTYDALVAKKKLLSEQYEKTAEKIEVLEKALKASNDALKKHTSETADLEAAQKKAQAAYDGAADKTDELKRSLNEANSAYERNRQNIEYTERRIQTYTQQLNKAEAEHITLGRELSKTDDYLREAAVSADGTATSIDKYGKEVKDAAEDTKEFADVAETIARVLAASGLATGVEELTELIIDCAKSSIEFESAFAGVEKTVDGTDEELKELSDGIKDLATKIPLTTTELAKIAETAGQLGIAKKDILTFTEVVANLVATTDLSAEEAAVSLARIANITGLMTSEYKNFGSTLVDLGNNSAAFESEILEMTNRLAGTGSIVEATNAQLLGVATTLVSLGIEAEAGGTAFSKLLTNIELAVETGSDQLQQYADIAGMSVEQFSDAWRNDAVEAVSAFIDGLGNLKSEGQSAIVVLDDMGISEVRLRDTILKLTEADGLLTENLERSNAAWTDNNALTAEAEKRYETTESKITLAKTAIDNLKITIGNDLLSQFDGFIGKFTDLVKACDEYIKKNPDVVTGINTLKKALNINTELTDAKDSAKGLVKTLQDLKKEYTETSDAAVKLSAFEETKRGYEKLSETISDYDKKLEESRETLKGLREEQKKLLEQQSQTAKEESAAAVKAASLQLQIDEETKAIKTYIEARNELGTQRRQTAEDLALWETECAAATDAVENVGNATENTGEKLETVSENIAEAAEDFGTITQTIESTQKEIDSAGQSIIDYSKNVKSALDTLVKEYDNAYKSAQSSLGGIGGLFDEVAFTTEKSVDDMIKGLSSQADYFMGYMQNLNRAAQIGIDQGLIASLADGSDQSAGYIQRIIAEFNALEAEYGSGSAEAQSFVSDFNAAFKASSEAKDALSHTMAGIVTDFENRKDVILKSAENLLSKLKTYTGNSYEDVAEAVLSVTNNVQTSLGSLDAKILESSQKAVNSMSELRESVDKQLEGTEKVGEDAGENYTAGIEKGIEVGTGKVVEATRKMAQRIYKTVNDELKIRSPSKVGKEQGEYYDEGIVEGIASGSADVVKSAVVMIEDLETQAENAAASAGTSIGQTIADNLTKSMLDGFHEAVKQGQAYVLGADGEKIPILPSSSIEIPENWDREAWLESMYAEGWNRGLSGQDIVNLLNAGVLSPPDSETLRQMGYDAVADAMEEVVEGMKLHWTGTDLLEQAKKETRTQSEKALEELLGLDLKANKGEDVRKDAFEEVFDAYITSYQRQAIKAGQEISRSDAVDHIYDSIIESFETEQQDAVKRLREIGEGFSSTDIYNAILESESYKFYVEKAGQVGGESLDQATADAIAENSDTVADAAIDMVNDAVSLAESAAVRGGQILASTLSAAFASKLEASLSSAVLGSSGSDRNVNVTFNQTIQSQVLSPYQTKKATESALRSELY